MIKITLPYRYHWVPFLLFCLLANTTCKAAKEVPVWPDTVKANAYIVQKMIRGFHCLPRKEDDAYYKDIATLFLKRLDPLHLYFTRADADKIYNIPAIKEEINNNNRLYSNEITALYKDRLMKADNYVSSIENSPFDFSLDEKYYLNEDSIHYGATEKEVRENMYKFMKFSTLDRIVEAELLDSTLSAIPIAKREQKAREVVAKIRHRRLKQLIDTRWGFDNLVTIIFLDAIVKANDPHSEFIPSRTYKRDWRKEGNAGSVSVGLILEETLTGDVEVDNLIPGSSAWKSGAIHKGDIIISIQRDDETAIDLEGADIDEVEYAFTEKGFKKVKIVVRNLDGEIKTAILTRGNYSEGNSKVESFILSSGNSKIGYIYLPSFYGNWESVRGSSCARDIDKALSKMGFEVDGVILDMRYNGGGSLGEANELAGIFLEDGTLGFIKKRKGFSTEMKDPYLGLQYDGPLVVMINNESASATEYTAAALQDYNRAVIVGSPSFGKATAQRYIPADTSLSLVDINQGIEAYSTVKDQIKITVGQLYRATGQGNQLRGVQPDIFLHGIFDSLSLREQQMVHYLPLDTLKRTGTYEPFPKLPIELLRQKSDQRVKLTSGFELVSKARDLYAQIKRMEGKPVSMQYSKYLAFGKKYLFEGRKIMEQIRGNSTELYKAYNYYLIPPDTVRNKPEPFEIELNKKRLEQLDKDIYIQESFSIMKDLIEIKKK
jgi:carboxyl-terminal processing protease